MKSYMATADVERKWYVVDAEGKTLSQVAKYPTENASNLDMEETHYKTAYTNGNNLYIADGDKVFPIESPDQDIVFGQSVHRNEFGIEKGTFLSPKGNYLAFYRMDQSMVTDYPLVNTTARIAREQPFKYPMAGMKSHEVTVGIYDAAQGSVLYLDSRHDESVAERENYLTNISWDPEEEFLYIAKVNREQNRVIMWQMESSTQFCLPRLIPVMLSRATRFVSFPSIMTSSCGSASAMDTSTFTCTTPMARCCAK